MHCIKYGPLNSHNLPQGPVQDAVLYHRITVKRHGKNKVNSMRYCVRVEYNGFAAVRLKTPQFRQGFDTTCPSDLSRIRRDRYFKAHVIKRIHLCDSGGIMRDVRAGILPRGALHSSYWNHLRQATAYPLFPASDSYSKYHGIKATHRKAQRGNSVARLIYPLAGRIQ